MSDSVQSLKTAVCYIKTRGQANVLNSDRERQRINILKSCRKLGLTPEFHEDHDPALSGNDLDRPGWNRLKARLGDPDVVALVVDEQTRITRSIRLWMNVLAELEQSDVTLHYAALDQTVNFAQQA